MSLPSAVSAELFRAIAEYTYDWETWVDAGGVTRWINAAVQRITGYGVEECLARLDYPLWLAQDEDRKLLADVLADAARGGSGNDVEFRIVPRQGGQRWVAISWQAVRSAQGEALGYRTSVRDIDQRKRTEQELHETRRRAEALAQARTELLANVSHELRSPAHCIAGFAELLLQAPLASPQRRYVELIADQCQSMLRQVEDLLSLSALEAGGVELAQAPVDLVALSDALIEGSAQEARARGLTLRAQVAIRECWLLGDALRIKQILRNLIDNALKFTDRGGVVLSLSEDGQGRWLLLTVSDTGQGMAPDQIETLRLPFRQGDASSSRRRGGVGLGLAIVERLVRAMNGELAIESQPGQGTTVCVRLPFVAANAPVQVERPAPATGWAGRALVVDDSAPARELLVEMLRLRGFSSVEAASARAALEAVEREPFEIVFLDYQMPDRDGGELAEQLRAIFRTRGGQHVPIYILTANVFANEQLRETHGVIDGVLVKPLSRVGLDDVLRAAQRQVAAAQVGAEQPLAPCVPGEVPLLYAELVDELRETRASNGQTLLQKLLPQAEHDMRVTLQAAHERLAERDWPALRRLVHAAAGHAAVLGALRARELSRALEQQLLEGAGPQAEEVSRTLQDCDTAFMQALSLLR